MGILPVFVSFGNPCIRLNEFLWAEDGLCHADNPREIEKQPLFPVLDALIIVQRDKNPCLVFHCWCRSAEPGSGEQGGWGGVGLIRPVPATDSQGKASTNTSNII